MVDKFKAARLKYKPEPIKTLLIAEGPPRRGSDRFFYYEVVNEQDGLFLETMKCLYPEVKDMPVREVRNRKRDFLQRFKNNGFYLEDALDEPFEEKYSPSEKKKKITTGQQQLVRKIRQLIGNNPETPVILIATTVYEANATFLRQQGINIINKCSIDFPGSGGQKKFKHTFSSLVSSL